MDEQLFCHTSFEVKNKGTISVRNCGIIPFLVRVPNYRTPLLYFRFYSEIDIMKTPESILETARERALAQGLPYAGALLPEEAHALMQQHPGARLVDVRTRAEWEWVGRVPLPNTIFIEWNSWPGGQPNPDFLSSLKSQVGATDVPILFLCRSGGRSHNAAATATHAGYTQAINVLQGFEGDRDQNGQRNTVGGWRAAGLPWIQG